MWADERREKMKLYRYRVSGIAAPKQIDSGKRRNDAFYCRAYSDEQALAWAEKHCAPYVVAPFIIESKILVEE